MTADTDAACKLAALQAAPDPRDAQIAALREAAKQARMLLLMIADVQIPREQRVLDLLSAAIAATEPRARNQSE